jgi:transcriptional regulator with XRE-family HTH domain
MPRFSGQRLRAARKVAGLSRERVAVAAGVSVSSIERYEQGTGQPGVEAAARLASVLGLSVDDLLDIPQTTGAAA